MWERFTKNAKRVIDEARNEAGRLGSDSVRDDHIMLGICRVPEAVATRTMKNLNIDLDALSREIKRQTQGGRVSVDGFALAWTPRAKKVLELALEKALRLNHSHIGTEHVLLGLVAYEATEENPGFLAGLLDRLTGKRAVEGAIPANWRKILPSCEEARAEIIRLLGESSRNHA